MKIIILTQEENLYLPKSFATVCREFPEDVVCIVSSPAMSTHGGAVKGFIKHFRLFGIKGTWIMGWRVIMAKLKAKLCKPTTKGPFYSIRQVADAFAVPYYHVPRVKDQQFQDILDKHKPDLLISISCPQIIGKKIRDRIPMGCINVHGAPLPKYRGLMPAFWVLRNGETKTATSVHDLIASETKIESPPKAVVSDRSAEYVIASQHTRSLFDALGNCRLQMMELGFEEEHYAELYSVITGRKKSWEELLEISAHIWQLTRAFSVREIKGFGRHLDLPPARFYEEPIADGPNQGHVLSKEDIHNLLTWYYSARGWDDNGIPTRQTLIRAGLSEAVEDFHQLGPKLLFLLIAVKRVLLQPLMKPDLEWMPEHIAVHDNCPALNGPGRSGVGREDGMAAHAHIVLESALLWLLQCYLEKIVAGRLRHGQLEYPAVVLAGFEVSHGRLP